MYSDQCILLATLGLCPAATEGYDSPAVAVVGQGSVSLSGLVPPSHLRVTWHAVCSVLFSLHL